MREVVRMSSGWQKPFVGFLFCVVFPSIAIFKKAGLSFLLLYLISSTLALYVSLVYVVPLVYRHLTARRALFISCLVLLGITVVYLIVHPSIDVDGFQLFGRSFGASDSDDAIDVALSELINGNYPYYARTFLDQLITPMPGTLAYALPFYLLGDSGIQNVFWLFAFYITLSWYYSDFKMATIVCALVISLSPNVFYHVLQGTDYISNSIYVLLPIILLYGSIQRTTPAWQSVVYATLLGIALSSRPIYILLAPLIFFVIGYERDLRTASKYTALILLTFTILTLPFFLYDPQHFSPLHTASVLTFDNRFPYAPMLVPASGGALAIVLGITSRKSGTIELIRNCFVVLVAAVVSAILLGAIAADQDELLRYFHFGILFMFFGVFVFGPSAVYKSIASVEVHSDHQSTELRGSR